MTRKILALGSMALLLAFAAPAFGQNSVTGAVQGVVNDKSTGEGLAGVTVVVTSRPDTAFTMRRISSSWPVTRRRQP